MFPSHDPVQVPCGNPHSQPTTTVFVCLRLRGTLCPAFLACDDPGNPLHSSSSFCKHKSQYREYDIAFSPQPGVSQSLHTRYCNFLNGLYMFVIPPPCDMEPMRHRCDTPFPLIRHRTDSAARRSGAYVAFHLQQTCKCTAQGAVMVGLSSPCCIPHVGGI